MSKTVSGDFKKVSGIPEGEPWTWVSLELLCSPAWKGKSIHCTRLIDFLLIENMRHAGRENGYLAAPYNQLVGFGMGRRFISNAIKEAEALRLIEVVRGGKRNQVEDHMSRYELTFLPAKRGDQPGAPYWVQSSNIWEKTTETEIKKFRKDKKSHQKNNVQVHPW
jgi:hypothetical protein